jgi:hypothetical protein
MRPSRRLLLVIVWLLPFVAISLSAAVFSTSNDSIPNGLLYPTVPGCEKFVR